MGAYQGPLDVHIFLEFKAKFEFIFPPAEADYLKHHKN